MPSLPQEAALLIIFWTSFVVGLSGAVTPGPLLVYDVRAALRLGGVAGPLVSAGHAAVELALVLAVAAGAARLLTGDVAKVAVSLAGGGVLLWMGWGMVRHPAREDPVAQARRGGAGPSAGRLATAVGGALASVSNPFWVVWWASVGLVYILWSMDRGAVGLAAFYAGHISSDFAWYGAVALAVSRGRSLLRGRAYQGLVAACGLALLALGGFFLYHGVTGVLRL